MRQLLDKLFLYASVESVIDSECEVFSLFADKILIIWSALIRAVTQKAP